MRILGDREDTELQRKTHMGLLMKLSFIPHTVHWWSLYGIDAQGVRVCVFL